MGRDIDRRRIKNIEDSIKRLNSNLINTIKAFQSAFITLKERSDVLTKALNILGENNPEILELLQVQSKEGANEASGGDEQPRILPMPGARIDSGVKGTPESSSDKAGG